MPLDDPKIACCSDPMADHRPNTRQTRPAPRLYLMLPWPENPSWLGPALAEIGGSADIAAVLLRLREAGERTLIDYVKAIAPAAQDKGIAVLLDGHCDLVARAGADGAHLTGIETFIAALDTLKPDRITGAGGLRTRHDAMIAGERGADYLMFGEPNGGRPAFDAILERVAWWAELFEPPCIGYAADVAEIAPLVDAGADFVALEMACSDSREAVARIRAAAAHLTASDPVN